MNFLAHLYLADDSPESRIGSLMPDLVRGPLPRDLHPTVAAGARLHRKVDGYTDTHRIFYESRQRLRQRHGLYSGILVDVIYDHYLAANWQRWHDQPLDAFVAQVHDAFVAGHQHMPQRMRDIVGRMNSQQWLLCYASLEGIELTLRRMSQRLSERFNRDVRLHDAMDEMRAEYDAFADDFARFFPQLCRFAETARLALAPT
jgi:acyl carrier protein phosphodiesterase